MRKRLLIVPCILGVSAILALAGCVNKPVETDFDPYSVYSEEVTEYKEKYEGRNAETIYTARDLANGVNVYYLSGERNGIRIANGQMNIDYNIGSGSGSKQIRSLTNPDGAVYIENTGDAFIELTTGAVYTTAEGIETPELNSYRHGSYYYDTHILNNSFARATEATDKYEMPLTVPDMVQTVSDIGVSDGVLSFKIDDPYDPYVGWTGLDIDADNYTGIRITMKNTSALLCEIYVAAGSYKSINSDQKTSFGPVPDGEYHTYTLSLEKITGYRGSLKQLRLDFDKGDNDNISISKIEFLSKDTTRPAALLDRTFNTFTDKVNFVDRFFITKATENVAAIGLLTEVEKAKVEKLVVKDAAGLHYTLQGVDWETAEYVGFDVKDAGIFGYILLDGDYCGFISVSEKEDSYLITQRYVPEEGILRKKIVYEVGRRLYGDRTHEFDGFIREAEFERHPLETVSGTGNGSYLGYDSLRGLYVFSMTEATGFSHAYYEAPDVQGVLSLAVTGDNEDRTVYVCTHAGGGSLECAVLLDENNDLLPVEVEVSKNFGGDDSSSVFYPYDEAFSDTFFPLAVRAGKETKVNVLNLYQSWGKYPLKQISSIRFFTTYYHLSTGVTETNCIAPYFVYGKDYWFIPDFRPMSAPLWSGQPQHTSGGCPRVLQYTSSDQGFSGLEFTTKYIDSTGPVYADLRTKYLSEDGRIGVTYRHVEMPQTDEARAYYDIEFTVLEDVPIADFKRDFDIFSMDGRFVFYKKLGYLDRSNKPAVAETNASGDKVYYKLGSECPYLALYDADSEDYVNMAIIVESSDVTIGGRKFNGGFIASDYSSWDLNRISLSLDLGKVTLKAGDTMKFRVIIFPYGSQQIKDDERVRLVRENTCLNPIGASSETDTVLSDDLIPKIRSNDGKTCEFTISGGAPNVPAANEAYYKTSDYNVVARVYGFGSFGTPEIYEKINGEWVRYEIASQRGYDGYCCYADPDNSFSYAFVITMNEAQPRTFKVVAG